jgi:hypothetical protein
MSKLAEQILRMVSGGDPAIESKIELAELEYQITLAGSITGMQNLINGIQSENRQFLGGEYTVEYLVTLTAGKIKSEKLCPLPTSYIGLAQDKGVLNVYYIRDNTMYPIRYLPGNSYSNASGSAYQATASYFYTVQSGKLIILDPCYDATNQLISVYVQLAVNNETTTDMYGALIIEKILPWARLQAGIRTDMVTDNNPNQ